MRHIKVGLCVTILAATAICTTGCQKEETPDYVTEYEKNTYNKSLYQGAFYADALCVTDTDIPLDGYVGDGNLHAAGLFDLSSRKVLYSQNVFEPLYPASTTKIMTAFVALKYGNLDDIVTVGENALNLEAQSKMCGLKVGDQLSLRDLLNGLLLYSGNDSAVAIAEHISGSTEAFAGLMNEEAAKIGATQSHFLNPHGLHEAEHYTTAYDLYLIFQECLKNETFKEIISQTSYTVTITNPALGTRTLDWPQSNYYSSGRVAEPEGVHVIGGKTGTTDEAGACVVLYEENAAGSPFISVVMGASNHDALYVQTSSLLTAGITAH